MTDSPIITVQVPVPLSMVHNAITGSLEGRMSSWLHEANLDEGYTKPDDNLVWWGHFEVFKQPFKFTVVYDDPELDEGNAQARKTIENADLEKALALMAKGSAGHFADLINESDDEITHDVFMQYLVIGEVKYG